MDAGSFVFLVHIYDVSIEFHSHRTHLLSTLPAESMYSISGAGRYVMSIKYVSRQHTSHVYSTEDTHMLTHTHTHTSMR